MEAISSAYVVRHYDLDHIVHRYIQFYSRLKRKKGFRPPPHGLMALVLDGHHSHSSQKQRCEGCLERRVRTKDSVKLEFYHTNVTALLVGRDFELLIDAEPQRPGENELGAARRLLDRVLESYPRAFDVVVGDAAYTDARFYEHVRSKGKHLLTVLKENQPTLLQEARSLLSLTQSRISETKRCQREIWDAEGFSFPRGDMSLRVVRSQETRRIRRQLTGQEEQLYSDWHWVTTLPQAQADSLCVVALGHSRWAIENQGFNECVNRWHADHVYKHDPTAILAFWLLCMSAFNLFQAFFSRNLKPEFRRRVSRQHIADLIKAELYRGLPAVFPQPP